MKQPAPAPRRCARGFTIVELLVVFAIVALGVGLVALALPDAQANRLEEEAVRLSSLLESARAEARVAGVAVRWVPRNTAPEPGVVAAAAGDDPRDFQFVGLPRRIDMPSRWLDPLTRARVVGASHLVLGPEAILPPQRVVLRLGEHRLELATDGLSAFALVQDNEGVPDGAQVAVPAVPARPAQPAFGGREPP